MSTADLSDTGPTRRPLSLTVNLHTVGTDVDEQIRGIASELASRVDELAHAVACAVRAEVAFYQSTGVVTNDELLTSSAENLRLALKCLENARVSTPRLPSRRVPNAPPRAFHCRR